MNEETHFNIDLNVAIQDAISMLNEDMEKSRSFDPKADYDEKNIYVNRTNQLGLFLLGSNITWAAEFYYRELIREIELYEKTSGKVFNKGIVYANLGIAELRSGKIDDGISHLLMAEREDKPIQPTFDILNSPLWHQFEKPTVFAYLMSFNRSGVDFTIDDPFVTGLVTNLDSQDRIFLESTLLSMLHNQSIVSGTLNSYSLGRLYSALKDICLLVESLLRKSQISRGYVQRGEQKTLFILLQKALREAPRASGFNIYATDNMTANSLKEFLSHIDQLGNEPNKTPLERYWLRYLILVRNFTGHHFDVSDTVLSPSGKTFFPELYELALQNVILALLYLKHIDAF